MKFYGSPNELVMVTKRINGMPKNIPLFTFDANGEYETNDIALMEKLKLHFKYDQKHCKKCDFTCEYQIDLMNHYKTHKEQ